MPFKPFESSHQIDYEAKMIGRVYFSRIIDVPIDATYATCELDIKTLLGARKAEGSNQQLSARTGYVMYIPQTEEEAQEIASGIFTPVYMKINEDEGEEDDRAIPLVMQSFTFFKGDIVIDKLMFQNNLSEPTARKLHVLLFD